MPTDPTGAHLKPALDAGISVVLVDRMIKNLQGRVSAVVVDNVDAAEKGTRYLTELGHVKSGVVCFSDDGTRFFSIIIVSASCYNYEFSIAQGG